LASASKINQLVVVIAIADQINALAKKLNQANFYFTRIDSTSVLVEDPTVCLLIGIDSQRHAELMVLIEAACQPRSKFIPTGFEPQMMQMHLQPLIEAQIGGAIVYTLDVDYFENIE
jgi:uncharacterized protein YaaQ